MQLAFPDVTLGYSVGLSGRNLYSHKQDYWLVKQISTCNNLNKFAVYLVY